MVTPDPWLVESELVKALNLPLNLMHNKLHPFAKQLSLVRANARRLAQAGRAEGDLGSR
jgi:hypothetical protein